MRVEGVAAFEYVSARDANKGTNVALYTPEAFMGKQPLYQQSWLCETRPDRVVFARPNDVYQFSLETYLVNGQFPQPAL